jgi:hypothetical protein
VFRTVRAIFRFAALTSQVLYRHEPIQGEKELAVNIAVSLANEGKGALIDGDMRRPSIHGYFNIANNVGLKATWWRPGVEQILVQPLSRG